MSRFPIKSHSHIISKQHVPPKSLRLKIIQPKSIQGLKRVEPPPQGAKRTPVFAAPLVNFPKATWRFRKTSPSCNTEFSWLNHFESLVQCKMYPTPNKYQFQAKKGGRRAGRPHNDLILAEALRHRRALLPAVEEAWRPGAEGSPPLRRWEAEAEANRSAEMWLWVKIPVTP